MNNPITVCNELQSRQPPLELHSDRTTVRAKQLCYRNVVFSVFKMFLSIQFLLELIARFWASCQLARIFFFSVETGITIMNLQGNKIPNVL